MLSAANKVMLTLCVQSQQVLELQLPTILEPPEDLVGFDTVPQGYDRGNVTVEDDSMGTSSLSLLFPFNSI